MIAEISLSDLLYGLGRWAGLTGFTCLSLLIFSGDTAKFFDRYFGLDKIIKFQRKFSLFTAFFILLHPMFFILSTQSITSYMIPNLTTIPLTFGITAFYIFAVIMIASKVYKRISHKAWQYFHILTYILFFFALYHAVNWGRDSNLLYIKILYGILLTMIIIGIIYRTQYKIKKRFIDKFHIKEIKQETRNTFTLIVTPKISFKAGQFCFLRLNKNKLKARHPFTISSSPKDTDLHFTIKNTGRFTQTASELIKGEEIILDGPFGNFIEKNQKKDLVFIAGGVGITPFMSIIKDHQNNKSIRNILLLYGSKTKEDIIFREELDCIKEEWFKIIYILSKEKSSSLLYGHINEDIIKKYTRNISNSLFYICGPKTMKRCVKKALINLGVKKQHILVEDFFW